MKKPIMKSIDELDNFCKEFDYYLLLEIPFKEIDGFLLRVVDGENEIGSQALIEIEDIDSAASKLLGKLSKEH